MTENQIELPEWMKETEEYVPLKDDSSFVEKTSKQMYRLLAKIKGQTTWPQEREISAAITLFGLLLTVFLTVIARNRAFPFLVFCVMLVLTAGYDGKRIRAILSETLLGIFFALLFTLPAAMGGEIDTMYRMTQKTAVTVMAVALVNHILHWNRICASISRLPFLDTFLFVFDLTIRYLVILGRICKQLLEAFTLRSIGRNTDKKAGIGGILGVTYLKSMRMAQETHQAMQCRGYDEKYRYYTKHKWSGYDVFLVGLLVLEVVFFFWFHIRS